MRLRLAPLAPVRIDVVPLGELRWQIAPLTTRAQQVQHCTEHLVQIELDRFGAASNAAQQRLDLGKFLWTDVAWVRLSFHPRIVGGKKIVNTFLDLCTRRTRKAIFIEEMEQVVPWAELLALIEPHAPRAKTGSNQKNS